MNKSKNRRIHYTRRRSDGVLKIVSKILAISMVLVCIATVVKLLLVAVD